MTGIERLRQMAEDFKNVKTAEHCTFIVNTWRGMYIDDAISGIADQIERERESLVADSPYDAILPEDRDAIAWVREHGGIEALRRMFQDADNRRVELCGALGIDLDKGWSEAMADMRQRLMPEGMEWPRFEDDGPVRFLDDFERYGEENGVSAVTMYADGSFALNFRAYSKGERVKRPAPKVLDADGVEIRVGDTVWHVETGEQCKVVEVDSRSVSVDFRVDGDGTKHTGSVLPANLTHRAPVLAADGRQLREGETVWSVDSGTRYTVEKIIDELIPIKCRSEMGSTVSLHPSQLTHERPDSWERLEEDAGKNPFDYCKDVGHRLDTCENSEAYKARDLVRRAKKLSGVGE